jgi:excinuclease ABC subunit B
MRKAVIGIEAELQERLAWFEANGKLLEAQRLRMRTQYDLEMMQEVGYCNGIENYSACTSTGACPASRRSPSSTTSPRLPPRHRREPRGGAAAARSVRGRPQPQGQLIEHGFRLPSAADNRPLRFEEAWSASTSLPVGHARPVRARAQPAGGRADRAPHRPGRPGGHRQAHQGPDRRSHRADQHPPHHGRPRPGHHAHQEDGRGPHRLPARAGPAGAVPAQRGRHHPAHRDPACLRLGEFDVLVGINLLREGLDLPEVSLVASSTPTRRASCAARRRSSR